MLRSVQSERPIDFTNVFWAVFVCSRVRYDVYMHNNHRFVPLRWCQGVAQHCALFLIILPHWLKRTYLKRIC